MLFVYFLQHLAEWRSCCRRSKSFPSFFDEWFFEMIVSRFVQFLSKHFIWFSDLLHYAVCYVRDVCCFVALVTAAETKSRSLRGKFTFGINTLHQHLLTRFDLYIFLNLKISFVYSSLSFHFCAFHSWIRFSVTSVAFKSDWG